MRPLLDLQSVCVTNSVCNLGDEEIPETVRIQLHLCTDRRFIEKIGDCLGVGALHRRISALSLLIAHIIPFRSLRI